MNLPIFAGSSCGAAHLLDLPESVLENVDFGLVADAVHDRFGGHIRVSGSGLIESWRKHDTDVKDRATAAVASAAFTHHPHLETRAQNQNS